MSFSNSRLLSISILLFLSLEVLAVDEVFEKPGSKKTWGESALDLVGLGLYEKSYALIVSVRTIQETTSPYRQKTMHGDFETIL